MQLKTWQKRGLLIAGIGAVIGGVIVLYLFNMPHRDVVNAQADVSLSATQIVEEYLKDPAAANEKYLDEEGESTILAIQGLVDGINQDLNGNVVILLKDADTPAGVSCTFTTETNQQAQSLKIGQNVTVKGVIRSGAGYDEDLELYENVILEKCNLIK